MLVCYNQWDIEQSPREYSTHTRHAWDDTHLSSTWIFNVSADFMREKATGVICPECYQYEAGYKNNDKKNGHITVHTTPRPVGNRCRPHCLLHHCAGQHVS